MGLATTVPVCRQRATHRIADLDLPQTLPRLRGRTPPPQPHVQPVHASHANRASASWFSRIVISRRLAHPQAFENPLRTPSDSIRPHYALGSTTVRDNSQIVKAPEEGRLSEKAYMNGPAAT